MVGVGGRGGNGTVRALLFVAASSPALGCAHGATAEATLSERMPREQAAVSALREGRFEEASREADVAIERHASDAEVRVVRGFARYMKTARQLSLDLRAVAMGAVTGGAINQRYLVESVTGAERDLAQVQADLEVAALSPDFAMELCIACWDVDWNLSGEVDQRDRRLLEVEIDSAGADLPAGDPRRRPTFRFDVGDVEWAIAMVAFQRAMLDLLASYDYSEIVALRHVHDGGRIVKLPLIDKPRFEQIRVRLEEGLNHASRERQAYLSETDDDREWMPNPKQTSHPIPLPVDEKLYATWGDCLADLLRIVRGEEGLSVAELDQLIGGRATGMRGYLDVGRMLTDPRNIAIDTVVFEQLETDPNGALRSVFGDALKTEMRASPLTGRLLRMMSEIKRGEEAFVRKLKYLLWLN
jgi:hypothetical protein